MVCSLVRYALFCFRENAFRVLLNKIQTDFLKVGNLSHKELACLVFSLSLYGERPGPRRSGALGKQPAGAAAGTTAEPIVPPGSALRSPPITEVMDNVTHSHSAFPGWGRVLGTPWGNAQQSAALSPTFPEACRA